MIENVFVKDSLSFEKLLLEFPANWMYTGKGDNSLASYALDISTFPARMKALNLIKKADVIVTETADSLVLKDETRFYISEYSHKLSEFHFSVYLVSSESGDTVLVNTFNNYSEAHKAFNISLYDKSYDLKFLVREDYGDGTPYKSNIYHIKNNK